MNTNMFFRVTNVNLNDHLHSLQQRVQYNELSSFYEKNKFKNFQQSSKLEDLILEKPDKKVTLEMILNKYRQ